MTSETDQQFMDRVDLDLDLNNTADIQRLFALARRGAAVAHTDDKRAHSPFANSENASDPECTCCGGTGITYQTERRCACQPLPPPPAGETNE